MEGGSLVGAGKSLSAMPVEGNLAVVDLHRGKRLRVDAATVRHSCARGGDTYIPVVTAY